MSCSPFDLKEYFLRELTNPQQRQVEAHIRQCVPCREELDRLRVTEAALLSVRDEEIPQRIAFVSDKIFEPSPLRRWWGDFWGSTVRLGFASAAMLSAAIVVYALHPVKPVVLAPATTAAVPVRTVSDAEIQARVDAAVSKAVAQVEARQSEQTEHLVSDLKSMNQRLLWATSELEMAEKQQNVLRRASLDYGPPHVEGDRQ